MYNSATAPKSYTSGRVYSSLFVRHWDVYIEEWRNNLFSGTLIQKDGVWTVSDFVNTMAASKLESPIPPFGGTDNYDTNGLYGKVAFVAKDPDQNAAINTASYVYIAALDGSKAPKPINKPSPRYSLEGASQSPAWSPDGTKLAYLQMAQNGYESDRNQLFIYADGKITPLVPNWDRSPSKVSWSKDGKSLFLAAEEFGRVKIFVLPSDPKEIKGNPTPLSGKEGSVTDYAPISNDKLLVTSTSLVSPTYFSVIDVKANKESIIFDPKAGRSTGPATLMRSQVEDFWAPRKDGVKIHSWVVKPSFYKEGKKYPLAFLIHGGPQGVWGDSWSTRWNPAIYAEQGYIVVAPNPTGSTGFGKKFTDAIQNDWGGAPYTDLILAYEYALKKYKAIDADRAVAMGASYGGYMINWIQVTWFSILMRFFRLLTVSQGNPFGRKFKALVCHDGDFSTQSEYSTEELWFPIHDVSFFSFFLYIDLLYISLIIKSVWRIPYHPPSKLR